MKNPAGKTNKKSALSRPRMTDFPSLLTPFRRLSKRILLPPLFLLLFSPLLYLAAPVCSAGVAGFFSLFLFPLLSMIALALSLRVVIASFKSDLPQKTAKGVLPSRAVRKRYGASYLLAAALSVAFWYLCTLLSLLLIASQRLIFSEIALLTQVMTSALFVFIAFTLLFLTFPLLIALMCFCSVARARQIQPKMCLSPSLLAFLPIYSLTLVVTLLACMITSFLDIRFIAPLAGADPLIAITFLWYILLLDILNIGFCACYFYYAVGLIGRRVKAKK